MTTANDSITVTPGAGASVATHLVGGKEYQAVVIANADGDVGGNPVYRLLVPSQAVGASKLYCDVFNATGTGKTMKVLSAAAYVDNDTAVTGTLGVQLDMFRTTAIGTGGTAATADGTASNAATISKLDTSYAALPAGVTARLAPTGGATSGAWLGTRWVFTEETSAPAGIAGSVGAEFVPTSTPPIYVRENSGLKMVQGSVASVGNVSFALTFELI